MTPNPWCICCVILFPKCEHKDWLFSVTKGEEVFICDVGPQAFKAVGFELTPRRLSQEDLVFSKSPGREPAHPGEKTQHVSRCVEEPGSQGLRAAAMS